MGVGYDFICKTCRKSYYLGYGSYNTTLYGYGEAETVESFDKRTVGSQYLAIPENQNYRACLVDHEGHERELANWDFYGVAKNGSLYAEIGEYGAPVARISDYGQFEHVDMTAKRA